MAKKKSSGPPYKKPKEKYLVVTSPWTRNKEGIAAWFAVMLKDPYPDASVNAIYTQKDADDTMIVQLSREVEDISYFLGAHLHSVFLLDRPQDTKVSYIYEYNFERHNDPAIKFHEYFPDNSPVPHPQFSYIKLPYPPPMIAMAPAPYVTFAKPISTATRELVAARIAAAPAPPPTDDQLPRASTSRGTLDGSSRPIPGHHPGASERLTILIDKKPLHTTVKTLDPRLAYRERFLEERGKGSLDAGLANKVDPYEDATRAQQLLQPLLTVKKEATDEFLSSLLPSVKAKETGMPIGQGTPPGDRSDTEASKLEGDYEPSAELQELYDMLAADDAHVEVKPEPVDVEIPEYQLSAEPLSTMPTPPPEHRQSSESLPQIKSEESAEVRVKAEPMEDASHTSGVYGGYQQLVSNRIYIKPEPEDFHIRPDASLPSAGPFQTSPTSHARLRTQHMASMKREGDEMDQGHVHPKRIKAEPQD